MDASGTLFARATLGGAVPRRWPSLFAMVVACSLAATALPATAATGPGGPQPDALPATVPTPGWAVGFSWTYRYVGPYLEAIGSGSITYTASYINDTYVSMVVGELATAQGSAWLVRNDHAGTMEGNATAPIIGQVPATATFTTVAFAAVRKSDYAVLNFTSDLNMTATVPVFGTVTGSAHNETRATPPFEQVEFPAPADGTPWPIVTNLTSTGWYQIQTQSPVATSGYLALDYNLSVSEVTNVTVPAGTFEVYNISGGGTADDNGNVNTFTQEFLWSPLVQNKVVDEGGYLLLDYDVNRPPRLVGTLPVLNVTAGEGADLDLSTVFDDPDGDPFTVTCQAPAGLNCSVGPGPLLNVTADPGLNETFNLTLTVDDGRPAGRVSFTLVVLVTGAGSINQPPQVLPFGPLTTPEDTPFHFVVADYFSDPDDGLESFQSTGSAPLTVTNSSGVGFDVVPPPDYNGLGQFAVTVFDFGGLSVSNLFTLEVTPVNDPPSVSPVGPATKTAHLGTNVTVLATAGDVDGDPLTYEWSLDNSPLGSDLSFSFPADLAGLGPHTVSFTATDPAGANATLWYTLLVFEGPSIVSFDPDPSDLTVGTGSTVVFRVAAVDPDSPVLDYRWDLDGAPVLAGSDRDNLSLDFPSMGTFTVGLTVADNGSNVSVAWQVTVVDVPDGLVSIVSPDNTSLIRVSESETVPFRATVDASLSDVTLEWLVDGVVVSTEVEFDWALASSGQYAVALRGTALYLGSIVYSVSDEVNISVVIHVPSPPDPPDPPDNTTNGTDPPPQPPATTPPDDGLLLWLVALVLVAAGALSYGWWRSSRRRRDGNDPP